MNTHPCNPQILSVEKIWDRGPHNAFTDLMRFADRWWWYLPRGPRPRAEHRHRARHLLRRWPRLGIGGRAGGTGGGPARSQAVGRQRRTPDVGGRRSLYAGTEYRTRAPRIAFSDDGYTWTTPQKVLAEDHWLWRVTWYEGTAYSVSKLGEGSYPRRGFL